MQSGRKPKSIKRVQSIELLRIVSAFGIVAYHAEAALRDWMYAGLVVFLVLSPMLDTRYNWERRRSVFDIAKNLLIPWILWMALHAVINLVQGQEMIPGGFSLILYGSSQHLWFLPFMFVALFLLNFLKRYPAKMLFWLSVIAGTALLLSAEIWRPISFQSIRPFPQWAHATAPVMFGICLGLRERVGPSSWGGIAMLGFGLAYLVHAQLSGVAIPYSFGVGLVVFAAWFGPKLMPASWNVQAISSCMMGVYLCHVLVLKIVGMVTGPSNYVTVTLSFIIATAGVWFVRRTMPASKIILG